MVLSTDGNASFAALVYQDPTALLHPFPLGIQVGFDAGDRIRGVNLLGGEGVNLFRIDGKQSKQYLAGWLAYVLIDQKLGAYPIVLNKQQIGRGAHQYS